MKQRNNTKKEKQMMGGNFGENEKNMVKIKPKKKDNGMEEKKTVGKTKPIHTHKWEQKCEGEKNI